MAKSKVSSKIRPGSAAVFNYPGEFKTLPDYTAHAGTIVRILKKLGPAENQSDEDMFSILAKDGWKGHAFESELELL